MPPRARPRVCCGMHERQPNPNSFPRFQGLLDCESSACSGSYRTFSTISLSFPPSDHFIVAVMRYLYAPLVCSILISSIALTDSFLRYPCASHARRRAHDSLPPPSPYASWPYFIPWTSTVNTMCVCIPSSARCGGHYHRNLVSSSFVSLRASPLSFPFPLIF